MIAAKTTIALVHIFQSVDANLWRSNPFIEKLAFALVMLVPIIASINYKYAIRVFITAVKFSSIPDLSLSPLVRSNDN